MEAKIIQLINATADIYAVFSEIDHINGQSKVKPSLPEHLLLRKCSVIALLKYETYSSVTPLILSDYEFDDPSEYENFLGYVESQDAAYQQFLTPATPSQAVSQ